DGPAAVGSHDSLESPVTGAVAVGDVGRQEDEGANVAPATVPPPSLLQHARLPQGLPERVRPLQAWPGAAEGPGHVEQPQIAAPVPGPEADLDSEIGIPELPFDAREAALLEGFEGQRAGLLPLPDRTGLEVAVVVC